MIGLASVERESFDGWRVHQGDGDPKIDGHTTVEVRFRDGTTGIGIVFHWDQNWWWSGSRLALSDGAIVGWRLAPG